MPARPIAPPRRGLPALAPSLLVPVLAACAPDRVALPDGGAARLAAAAAAPAPPKLQTVVFVEPSVYVAGTLRGAPNTRYRVALHSHYSCDISVGGTGVGAVDVVTDALGDATFHVAIETSDHITATATDPAGNSSGQSNCLDSIVSAGSEVGDIKPDVISVLGTTVVTGILLSRGGFDATGVHPSLVKLLVHTPPRSPAWVSVLQRGGLYNAFVRDVDGDGALDLAVGFAMKDVRAAGLHPTSLIALDVRLSPPVIGPVTLIRAADPLPPTIRP